MLLRLDGQGPRYAQITRALRGLIQSGALAPGTRVPSSRELARDLSCSRNLVLLAYEQLALEGYLTPRGGAGTIVSPDVAPRPASPPKVRPMPRPAPQLSRTGRRAAAIAARARALARRRSGTLDVSFMYGLNEPDARLLAAFRKACVRAVRHTPAGYPPGPGDERLRQQVALRLRTRRGIARGWEQVLVTNGTQQALEICARLLLGEGDRVAVEETTYDGATISFEAVGAEIVRVPVDSQGLVVSALPTGDARPRLVYVTPSHQFPTGVVMSAARRHALLHWAEASGAYIFEDDYDGEFRYHGRSLEALAAIDPEGPVIYSGTFAKSLFPSLRLGYLSLPEALVEDAVACKWLADRGCSALVQYIVGDLMASGEYDRHIRRMLRRNRVRRDALVAALRQQLGSAARIEGADAGLHLLVRLRGLSLRQVQRLVAECRARGVELYSDWDGLAVDAEPRAGADERRRPGLLLGYALLPVERIERGVRILAEVYRELTGAPREATRRRTS